MRRSLLRAVAAFFTMGALISTVSVFAKAQQTSSTGSVHTGPMPDQKFYSLVFRHLLYLQTNGETPVVTGGLSPSISHFYSDRVGATSAENATLLTEARAWKSEVDPVDNQAQAIIVAIRAKTPGGHLAPGQQPPAVPQQLIDLQNERDAITLKHVANLKAKFGAARFAVLDNQIHRVTHLSYRMGPITRSAIGQEEQ